ncbi:MAG TPA: 30S ribosomal protein S4 [Candidatus Nanoarchaeia archaeon]|nr:30S ribosomal protein S4 [Candidatus Nanoarchaeia archaeon]
MIRKHKAFSWPRKLYDKTRIIEENKLVEKYGLRNKREIWRSEAQVRYYRTRAKTLINASQEEQIVFFSKLNAIGLQVSSIADVLALTKENILKRRLSTILVARGFAATARQARQMITHRRVRIGARVVGSPSYIPAVDEESIISVKASRVPTITKTGGVAA